MKDQFFTLFTENYSKNDEKIPTIETNNYKRYKICEKAKKNWGILRKNIFG